MLISVIIDPTSHHYATVATAAPPASTIPIAITITPLAAAIPIAIPVTIPPALCRRRSYSGVEEGN